MDKKALIGTAKEIFAAYASKNTIHFTGDGQPFFEKHDADNHAKSLIDGEVTTIDRSELETASVVKLPKLKTRNQLADEYKIRFGVDAPEAADETAISLAMVEGQPITVDGSNADDKGGDTAGKKADKAAAPKVAQKASKVTAEKPAKPKAAKKAEVKPADEKPADEKPADNKAVETPGAEGAQ
jgi:hypothetical protein